MGLACYLPSAITVALVPIAGLAASIAHSQETTDGRVRVGFVEGAYNEATADGQTYRLLENDVEISVHLDPGAPTCLEMALFAPGDTNSKQIVEVTGPNGPLAKIEVGETTLSSPATAHIDLSRFAPDPVRLTLESEARVLLPGDTRDVSFGIALPVRAVEEAKCSTSARQPTDG